MYARVPVGREGRVRHQRAVHREPRRAVGRRRQVSRAGRVRWTRESLDVPRLAQRRVRVAGLPIRTEDLGGVPYVRLDGRIVGGSFLEITTLGLRTGISITEQLSAVFDERVWTNTSAFGERFSPV